MKKLLGFFICVIISVVSVHGGEYVIQGCSGKEDGERWTVHEDGKCMKCECDEDLELCNDCETDIDERPLMIGCYIKRREYNPEADYPDCCEKDDVICPGDDDFVDDSVAVLNDI